jgi:hypothetical protein
MRTIAVVVSKTMASHARNFESSLELRLVVEGLHRMRKIGNFSPVEKDDTLGVLGEKLTITKEFNCKRQFALI